MTESKLEALKGPVGPWRGAAPLAGSGIAVVCFTAALALAWMSAGTLLLIFAGVLLGVFLDGLTRALAYVLPLPRSLRLTLASITVALLALGFATYGGTTVAQQGRDLGSTIKTQADSVNTWLADHGIDVPLLGPAKDDGRSAREPGQQESGLGGLASGLLKSSGSVQIGRAHV